MKVKTILKLQVLILHQWKRGKIIKKVLMRMRVTMLKKKTKEMKNETKTLNGNIRLIVNG